MSCWLAMADQRLSVHDRVTAIDHLERMARELNLVASWLGEQGCEFFLSGGLALDCPPGSALEAATVRDRGVKTCGR